MCLFFCIKINAQQHNLNAAKGVIFQNITLDSAVKKAKAENKYVFISLYATWCGWCTIMKNNTYTNKALGEYFNARFVSLRINGEKGNGRTIRNKYGVTAYPTQFVINPQGQLITGSVGYKKPADLLKEIKAVFK